MRYYTNITLTKPIPAVYWQTYCDKNPDPNIIHCYWCVKNTKNVNLHASDDIEIVDYDIIQCQHSIISLLHDTHRITVRRPDVLIESPIVSLVIQPESNPNFESEKFHVTKHLHIGEILVNDIFDLLFANFNIKKAKEDVSKAYRNNVINYLKKNKIFNFNKQLLGTQATKLSLSRSYINLILIPFYQNYLLMYINELFDLIAAFPNNEYNIDCTFEIFNKLNHYDQANLQFLKLKLSLALCTGVFGLIRSFMYFEAASESNINYAQLVAQAILRVLYLCPVKVNIKITYLGTDNAVNQLHLHNDLITTCINFNNNNKMVVSFTKFEYDLEQIEGEV